MSSEVVPWNQYLDCPIVLRCSQLYLGRLLEQKWAEKKIYILDHFSSAVYVDMWVDPSKTQAERTGGKTIHLLLQCSVAHQQANLCTAFIPSSWAVTATSESCYHYWTWSAMWKHFVLAKNVLFIICKMKEFNQRIWRVPVLKYHKLGDLKIKKCIPTHFWRLSLKSGCWLGCISFDGSRGETLFDT